jgi:hypothetical protein
MLAKANDYQYLILGGIMGEVLALPLAGNYLRENKKIMIKNGIDAKNIHIKTLNSFKNAYENSHKLSTLLKNLYAKNKKKIILIAHSKACLESLICVGNHFEEVKETLHKMICVSPPFKGSSLFTKRENHWFDKASFSFLEKVQEVMPGVKSLTPNYYSEFFQERIVKVDPINKFVSENLLVIKGSSNSNAEVSWAIKPSHKMLEMYGKYSDGLVTLEDQMIDNLEYQQVVINMDHGDLFTSSLLSSKSRRFRTDHMRFMVNWAINGLTQIPTQEVASSELIHFYFSQDSV